MARSESSAGFCIFQMGAAPASVAYLLLNYGRHWDFPKGHLEPGEDDLTAAVRELQEETGITRVRRVESFKREITYFFRDRKHGLVRKTVVFFLGQVEDRTVTLSHEHVGFEFLPFAAALERLTYPTARQLLQEAHTCLFKDMSELPGAAGSG